MTNNKNKLNCIKQLVHNLTPHINVVGEQGSNSDSFIEPFNKRNPVLSDVETYTFPKGTKFSSTICSKCGHKKDWHKKIYSVHVNSEFCMAKGCKCNKFTPKQAEEQQK